MLIAGQSRGDGSMLSYPYGGASVKSALTRSGP
jgi:hypothetical protein